MGLTNYPHGVTSRGVPIFGNKRSDMVTGNVFFVDSGNTLGSDSTSAGKNTTVPFSTIDYAIGQCTASNGDVIYVMPGHAETIIAADAIDVDVVGVSIIGIGNGSNKPTITYNHANAEVVIGADDVYIENIRFLSSITEVLLGMDVEDSVDNFHIANCEFLTDADTTDDFISALKFTNNSEYCIVENCVFDSGLQGHAVQAIYMDADCESLQIVGCRIMGDYTEACIVNDTAICTEILIKDCILQNGDSTGNNGEPCIEIGASTGLIVNNYMMDGTATDDASSVATGCVFFNNQWSTTVASGKGIITTPNVWT